MKQNKVEKFSGYGSKTTGIPLKNPESARGGEGTGVEKNSQKHRRMKRSRESSYEVDGRRIPCL